jgi:hypothetical protein
MSIMAGQVPEAQKDRTWYRARQALIDSVFPFGKW